MRTKRVVKALAGLAFTAVASLAQAQPAGAESGSTVATAVNVAPLAADTHSPALRTSQERLHKSHHDIARVPAAIMATPVAYPAAPGPTALRSEGNGELKGWVLVLMGAFLIITIFQRRYQALSDI